MNQSAATFVLLCLLVCGLAQAVMIRHDVPEERYLDLARDPAFRAGCVTIVDARGDYTGILIGRRWVLTVGHPVFGFLQPGESSGPLATRIRIADVECESEFAHLHPSYDRVKHFGGADLSLIRLRHPGVARIEPATIFAGGIALGDRFVGIGQGKSGTGLENDEPKPAGTFRGYENTVDYLFPEGEFAQFRADFDNGTDDYNTLARVLYGENNLEIQGGSSKDPLPLEGAPAAGDSGSGVWVKRNGSYLLAGVASYRHYSMYGGQGGYVNLSHPAIIDWIERVAHAEGAQVKVVRR